MGDDHVRAVVGTTNRIEALDPAVCRPGRFDYHIEVASPNPEGRSAILRVYLGKIKTRSNLHLDHVVERTEGFSGAELAAVPLRFKVILGQQLGKGEDRS
jgi:ATP-dependent 26S proteasome regulatory subunit